ncbi:hypothetical protein HPULCUR_003637 [Helicostylum pulchrum]|uniref:Arrestin C-terminal-like domain-containing protein n=1 Tax=Helicostylum pulchrum TaxID=562976 RepID=A0ABP9XTY6_9FUNG
MWHRRSSRAKLISIQLLEPIIFINPDQDTAPVVRGTIHVLLDKTMRLQKLNIHFHGTIKTQWKKEGKVVNSEKQLVSEDLSFSSLDSTDKFPFEMPLPSGIPETVSSADIGVQYTMAVDMYYKKMNTMCHEQDMEQIILARLPDQYPIRMEALPKQFLDWCKYCITIDKKTAALGSRLPVKIEITPFVPGFKLKQVFLQLLERRTVIKNNIEKTNQSCYFIYPAKNSLMMLPSRPLNQPWQASCYYQLPDNNKLSHSTMEYSNFKISHSVLVSLIVSVPDKARQLTKTISYQVDIDLLSNQVNQLDEREYLKLPAYNCIMTGEELEKLNRHGLGITRPPSYEESIAV